MVDLLLQIAFSYTCFALAIGGVAMVVGAQANGPNSGDWYAMDTEFKFDHPTGGDPKGQPVLFIKQARPYPGMRQP